MRCFMKPFHGSCPSTDAILLHLKEKIDALVRIRDYQVPRLRSLVEKQYEQAMDSLQVSKYELGKTYEIHKACTRLHLCTPLF